MEETEEGRRRRLARDAAAQRRRRAIDPESARARDRAYKERNKEERLLKRRAWAQKNAERIREQRRKWNAANRDRQKDYHLKAAFGVDLDWYNTILKKQKGCCAICKQPPTKRRLAVDHNHATGKVRGLLCKNCNIAIGLLDENVERARFVIKYLIKYKEI
jgi:hypothetical protein